MFKGAKLEIESVIRDVCDKVLYDTAASKQVQRLRAEGLGLVGEVFSQVKAEEPEAASS